MSCAEVMFPLFSADGLYRQWKDPLGSRKAGLPQMQDTLDSENYSSTSGAVIKEEEVLEKELVPKDTQYLTANCVLFTYFTGDTSSVVDEHFSRALSQASNCNSGPISATRSSAWKDGWPMSQRNFPPSFWNSAYQPPSVSMSSSTLAADPYLSGSFHGFSGFHPQDAWHYPSTSQARSHAYSHHRPMTAMPSVHDFSYSSMTSPGHYSPHYGSILMQQSLRPGRLPHGLSHQYDLGVLGKSPESWGSRLNAAGRLGADFTTTSSLDPSASGLDSGLQETTKEPYWF